MKLELPLKGIGTIPGIYETQGFGGHLLDYSQFGMIGHNGIDWAAPLGTPVYAAHGGTLQFYGDGTTGYGFNARIYFDEDNTTWDTVYGHFEKYEGQPRIVQTGDIIGYVDSTGFSTGNHLHFGIRKLLNGQVVDPNNGYLGYIDPQPFFKGQIMNEAKIVKSKTTQTVFVCYPVPDMDYLQKKANLEGLIIPNPIPDTDSLT